MGVPLFDKAPRRFDFSYILEKVKLKFASSKAWHLSFVGLVTISKVVIEALLIYTMMSTSIPKPCWHEIQKLQCSFIEGYKEEHWRVQSVKWGVMMLQKLLGRLGVRWLDVMSNACLLKLGWAIHDNEQSRSY